MDVRTARVLPDDQPKYRSARPEQALRLARWRFRVVTTVFRVVAQ